MNTHTQGRKILRILQKNKLTGELGFEPRFPVPETGVLPLDDSPKRTIG